MGISEIKVVLLVGVFIIPLLSETNGCQFDKQYWSSKTGTCVDCTKCKSKSHEVVIRPCQVNDDTVCGPISELKVQWPSHKQHDHHRQKDANHKNLNHVPHHHHHHSPSHVLAFHDLPIRNINRSPLNSVEEWERILKKSRAQLQHRKEDLMKSLLQRKNAENLHHQQELEEQNVIATPAESQEKVEELLETHHPHFSNLNLEILEKLVTNEHTNRNKRPLEPLSLVDERLHKEDEKTNFHKSGLQEDFPELYDFMAMVPAHHHLFFGEPSTVPEMMMDQNNLRLEESVSSERVPFTTAEAFIWDWQAVAMISAIVACLLFFALAAVFSIIHARQWRRVKDHFNVDVEDLALRVSLMQNGSSNNMSTSDGSNTNHYLEQLVADKKIGENKSNIYIEKQSS